MKKKKITALICTAALMAGCLAGCGKGDGGNAVQADADKGTASQMRVRQGIFPSMLIFQSAESMWGIPVPPTDGLQKLLLI